MPVHSMPAATSYPDAYPVKRWLEMDTIKTRADGEWLSLPAPAGWTRLRRDSPAKWQEETGFMAFPRYRHEPSGLILSGGQSLRFVTVSLPRLLHGSNCQVIRNQAELDKAIAMICPLVAQVVDGPHLLNFTRCDLAWNLPLRAGFVKAHLQRAQHAWFRGLDKNPARNVTYQDNDNFTLKGAGKRICLYDKGLNANGVSGYLRPELRLENPHLREKLGTCFHEKVFGLSRLDFMKCYSVWRDCLLAFANGPDLFGPYCPPQGPLICDQFRPSKQCHDTAEGRELATNIPRPLAI